MSFNKRFISDESLNSASRKTFPDFNRYMTNSDLYVAEGKYAPAIWEIYDKKAEVRSDIWWMLSLDYSEKESILELFADLWRSPDELKENSILKMTEECLECPAQKIKNIIQAIKK